MQADKSLYTLNVITCYNMLRNIRKIGNSEGIIIPQSLLKEIGSPTVVDISPTEGGIILRPVARRVTRSKPRDEDEIVGIFSLMRAKIENNIKTGKTRWTGAREMERRL